VPSGEAPIAEASTLDALRARRWSHRGPLPNGFLSLLTVLFWGLWLYLVLPLVSLLLWALGLRLFVRELTRGSYEGLLTSLIAYSSVLLVFVGLLALWIAWNVVRYGGRNDRRSRKREEVTDREIQEAFRLDDSLLSTLRDERVVRLDLDAEDCVVMTAQPRAITGTAAPSGPGSALPAREPTAGEESRRPDPLPHR
jgi:poly-beta-1,6-N-acetyl-D-glucosamine biosynthesis protein PgaD